MPRPRWAVLLAARRAPVVPVPRALRSSRSARSKSCASRMTPRPSAACARVQTRDRAAGGQRAHHPAGFRRWPAVCARAICWCSSTTPCRVAQLQQAQAQASIARTNLQRNRELVRRTSSARAQSTRMRQRCEVAEAQVALARGAVVARWRILAPFDGVVGIRSVAVGDYVKDGADLVNLEDRSRMWVDFRLPERFAGAGQGRPGGGGRARRDARQALRRQGRGARRAGRCRRPLAAGACTRRAAG